MCTANVAQDSNKISSCLGPPPSRKRGASYIQRSFLAVAVRPQLRKNCSLRTVRLRDQSGPCKVLARSPLETLSPSERPELEFFPLRLRNTTMPLGHCHL